MGKRRNIEVLESDNQLKKLLSKYKEERRRKRIRMLISLKVNSDKKREEIASELGIGKRTLERWIGTYANEGIDAFLAPITRDRSSSFITQKIHEALLKRLSDPKNAFGSYIEIQAWLSEEFGCDIKYENLYYYIRAKFKTKLKVPRKSHINKDEQAEAFFKNPTVQI